MISEEVRDAILKEINSTSADLKKALTTWKRPISFPLLAKVRLAVESRHFPQAVGYNVVGFIEGSDPKLRRECVVIGGHFDHTGAHMGLLFPGADDNASGCATVMEAGKAFAALARKPKRSIVIALFGGEGLVLQGAPGFGPRAVLPQGHHGRHLRLERAPSRLSPDGGHDLPDQSRHHGRRRQGGLPGRLRLGRPLGSVMRVAKQGLPFILPSFALILVFLALGWWPLAALFLLLACAFTFFFRDPDRVPPPGERLLVSPADGEVLAVEAVDSSPDPAGPPTNITLFLSLLDVHLVRSPLAATVARGQKGAVMCLGARVELIRPRAVTIKVGLHDKVKAGATVIGEVQP